MSLRDYLDRTEIKQISLISVSDELLKDSAIQKAHCEIHPQVAEKSVSPIPCTQTVVLVPFNFFLLARNGLAKKQCVEDPKIRLLQSNCFDDVFCAALGMTAPLLVCNPCCLIRESSGQGPEEEKSGKYSSMQIKKARGVDGICLKD